MYAPAILNIDSSATLALSMTKQASTWTKHIDSKYHFGKDAFKAGQASLSGGPTAKT